MLAVTVQYSAVFSEIRDLVSLQALTLNGSSVILITSVLFFLFCLEAYLKSISHRLLPRPYAAYAKSVSRIWNLVPWWKFSHIVRWLVGNRKRTGATKWRFVHIYSLYYWPGFPFFVFSSLASPSDFPAFPSVALPHLPSPPLSLYPFVCVLKSALK